MKSSQLCARRIGKDILVFVGALGACTVLCAFLSGLVDDNNPFATLLYVLAVALISRFTTGYLYGVLASVVSVVCVNYLFTYPFLELDLTLAGYPLTFAVMLLVSLLISTLTTQVKKQEQLRFAVESEKMRANLLRAVSHDLRTPLASILGASSALQDAALAQQDRDELLHEIRKDAEWLSRMTENLLSVTKFSTENVTLQKSEEVVEEILGSAIVKFRKSRQEIPILVKKPDEILLAPMDGVLIQQVLINLFENVAMHAETATRIEVSIARKKGRVAFDICDDGVGFPTALLPHIFDGCASVTSRSHSDSGRNMGIGLSVCHTIVRAHGGDMTAQNKNDGGACISFWLPCEEGA